MISSYTLRSRLYLAWASQHNPINWGEAKLPGYVTWGPGLWSLLKFTRRFSAKNLHVSFPVLAAFSSSESRVLIKYVLVLLLLYSNTNIIVVPRGLELGPTKLYAEQTQPWDLAKELACQASAMASSTTMHSDGSTKQEETPGAAG